MNKLFANSKISFSKVHENEIISNSGIDANTSSQGGWTIYDTNATSGRDWIAGVKDNPNALSKLKRAGWNYIDAESKEDEIGVDRLVAPGKTSPENIAQAFMTLFKEVKPLTWKNIEHQKQVDDIDDPNVKNQKLMDRVWGIKINQPTENNSQVLPW